MLQPIKYAKFKAILLLRLVRSRKVIQLLHDSLGTLTGGKSAAMHKAPLSSDSVDSSEQLSAASCVGPDVGVKPSSIAQLVQLTAEYLSVFSVPPIRHRKITKNHSTHSWPNS